MTGFDDLLVTVKGYSPEADTDLLRRAYEFSSLAHAGQTRRSGEQYITHPLEVAGLVADMHLDDIAIAASLLHDVVEDTLTTIENVAQLFGADVAHVVEGVTKISTIPFSSVEERQAENFRKMLLAMVDDVRVILVKLADRLHNMRTLDHLQEVQRVKIAQETLDIYAPIAHRLGMSKIKNELEALAFRYVDPLVYESLRAQVDARRRATQEAVVVLNQTLERKLRDGGIPIIALEGRTKRLFSIWKKMRRQKISLDQVYDLVAVRVVTESVKDCYAALGIIHQTWHRCLVGLRILSQCLVRTVTGRYIRQWSVIKGFPLKCKYVHSRCIVLLKKASRLTGNIKKDALAPQMTSSIFFGCASCWNGSTMFQIRASLSVA